MLPQAPSIISPLSSSLFSQLKGLDMKGGAALGGFDRLRPPSGVCQLASKAYSVAFSQRSPRLAILQTCLQPNPTT